MVKGGSPFSAVEVTTMTQTLADGNRIVRTFQRKVYRDSQGRERADSMQEPTMSVCWGSRSRWRAE